MGIQTTIRFAQQVRRRPVAGILAGVAMLVLSACATPKPFEVGEVRPGFMACADYADIDRANNAEALPDGCRDAGGREYEVVVSSERYTLVDLTVPSEDRPVRAYVLRRGL